VFDRFTDKAKKSMNLARMAAQEFGHQCIAPEHSLHGLLRAGECSASLMLVHSKVIPETLLEDLRKRMRRSDFDPAAQLPFTPDMKRALEAAMNEASAAGHNYIGTGHLLLGIAKVEESLVSALLRDHGVSYGMLLESFGSTNEGLETSAMPDTARRHTLQGAARIARQLGDEETARKIEALIQRLPP